MAFPKITPSDVKNAKKWFLNKIRSGIGFTKRKLNADTRKLRIGSMYGYVYDAKWKDALPYWDSLPLTVIVHFYPDGFLGMNMHYLNPHRRAILMGVLQNFGTDNKNAIKLSYAKLCGLANTHWKYTIHRYLFSHIKSTPVMIEPGEWFKALALPVNSFQKQSAQHVWSMHP